MSKTLTKEGGDGKGIQKSNLNNNSNNKKEKKTKRKKLEAK